MHSLCLLSRRAVSVGTTWLSDRHTVFPGSFYFITVASSAGGLRHCNGAAFASLKNLATLDIFNADFVVTEPKKAPYATTGEKNAAVLDVKFKAIQIHLAKITWEVTGKSGSKLLLKKQTSDPKP